MSNGYGGGPGGGGPGTGGSSGDNGNGNGNGGIRNGRNGRRGKITADMVRDISYISGANSHQILSINRDSSSTGTPVSDPDRVLVQNVGATPIVIMLGYEGYVSSTADVHANTTAIYVHSLLLPGEKIQPHLRSVVNLSAGSEVTAAADGFADESLYNLDGTAVDWTAPGTTLKADSGADVKNNTLSNTSDPVSFGVTVSASANSKYIRVGDLIRIENEIMEVLGTYEDDPTNSSLVAGDIRCKRGMYGSTNASHTDTPDIYFPYFNTFSEFDKYASAGYTQTNEAGQYASRNFFGLARNDSTAPMGLTPGSVCFRFYSSGYQELGLQGITSATNTGLTASTAYAFDIQVDGGTNFDNLTFTTDSSNLNFGGANGVLSKIQSALNTQYYTAGNLFEKAVTVSIVHGDIRFTSASRLSTSAIALTVEDGSDASFFGTGRIPAIGSIRTAMPSTLPEGLDEVQYDPITGIGGKMLSHLAFDNGRGGITGVCKGNIDYETGAFRLFNAPANANFEYSVLHSGPFSGKRDPSEGARANSLIAIHANVLNKKMTGKVRVVTEKR